MKKFILIIFCLFLVSCTYDLHSNRTLVNVNDQGNMIDGICVDHATAKQVLLKKQGIKSYLATAWLRPIIESPGAKGFTDRRLSSELVYHMVCIVPTNEGDFVLDNYHTMVYHWKDVWFKWDIIQTSDGWRQIVGEVQTEYESKMKLGKEVIPPLMNLNRKVL